MSRDTILRAEQLVKTFGSGKALVRAVDDVSLTVTRGELVLIMGPSGSGKTTLVSMLGALLSPDSGSITIEDSELTTLSEPALASLRALKIGFIFQSFNLLDALSVQDNVLFPAHLAPGGVGAARPRAEALLKTLKLWHRRDARPNTLSGGEKQRVAIARALVNQPRLIFADEPTGNLDSTTGRHIMDLLLSVHRTRHSTLILVTHDAELAALADSRLVLRDGRPVDSPSGVLV